MRNRAKVPAVLELTRNRRIQNDSVNGLVMFFSDHEYFNLADDWADYKNEDDAKRWEDRDRQIKDFLDSLSDERRENQDEFREDILAGLLEERIGRGKDYDEIWKCKSPTLLLCSSFQLISSQLSASPAMVTILIMRMTRMTRTTG